MFSIKLIKDDAKFIRNEKLRRRNAIMLHKYQLIQILENFLDFQLKNFDGFLKFKRFSLQLDVPFLQHLSFAQVLLRFVSPSVPVLLGRFVVPSGPVWTGSHGLIVIGWALGRSASGFLDTVDISSLDFLRGLNIFNSTSWLRVLHN